MQILLPTDLFPPGNVGGAAWSALTLAQALQKRNHTVTALVPVQGQKGLHWGSALGIPLLRHGYYAPRLPFLQNYYRYEKLWPSLAATLVDLGHSQLRRSQRSNLLIHAQHSQVAPAAILAGHKLGVPVVVTVRDHWPWDYFATGLHGNRFPYQMREDLGSRWAAVATDLLGRLGPKQGILALPAIPYILAHLKRRATFLAQADAVIAVSNYIAQRLAGIVPKERLFVLPNMVDLPAIEEVLAQPPKTPLPATFLLFVGKLEPNKGVGLLPEILREAGCKWPLLIVGKGSLQQKLKEDLSKLGVPVTFLNWASHEEVLRLLARTDLLLFPSLWGEPLSRVLLEACAVGTPILAMPTGGTPDILTNDLNGLLAASPQQFAQKLNALLANPFERQRLRENAKTVARQRFAVEAVIPQVEQLYATLLG